MAFNLTNAYFTGFNDTVGKHLLLKQEGSVICIMHAANEMQLGEFIDINSTELSLPLVLIRAFAI